MVLIKTRKNTFLCNKLFALEENAGLAHVLDDAGKKEKMTTASLQTNILTNGVLNFRR